MMNHKSLAFVLAVGALTIMHGTALAQRCQDCVAEDSTRQIHLAPAFGLRVGAPQKASVALGVAVGENWQANGRDHSRNLGIFAEPGIAGGRASVAVFDQGYGQFGSGFGIAASVLRTWKDPWWADQNVTYAGGEVILFPILFVGPRIGLFRAVGATGAGPAKRWLVTFDFGFGL